MRLRLLLLATLLPACPADDGDPSGDDDDATADDDDATPDDDDSGDDDDSAPACPAPASDPGQVETTGGLVQGVPSGAGWAFFGLPYAEAPVGDLRLAAPEPRACREAAQLADTAGPRCPQLADDAVVGDEDCLHLNVWTPQAKLPLPPIALEQLPVLFFVHGGGNVQGATTVPIGDGPAWLYDGARITERFDALVVTANYRVGALGWLAAEGLQAEGPSGNYGLRDLLTALAWVRDNIEAFGGDPSRVLLFGESAGAVNTCALLASPAAAGLFSAAIMQSGGCSDRALVDRMPDHLALLSDLGCANAADLPACLRALDVADFPALNADPISVGVAAGNPFGPVADGDVLPATPLDAITAGEHNAVPFVIGANDDEMAVSVPTLTESTYEALVQQVFGPFADDVLAQYPVTDYPSARWAWIAVSSQAQFICPARRIARAAAPHGDVWRYHFTHVPGGPAGLLNGSFHGLELGYVFQGLDAIAEETGYNPTPADAAIEQAMGSWWTAFASGGEPDDLAWPAYDAATDRTLQIEEPPAAVDGIYTANCDFWDSVLEQLGG